MINVKKYSSVLLVIIVAVMLIGSVFSFIRYSQGLNQALTRQTREDMEQRSRQSVTLAQTILNGLWEQLNTVSMFYSATSNENNRQIDLLLRSINTKTERQIGVANSAGLLYTGGGPTQDVSARSYFLAAMEGKPVVSQVLEGMESREPIIVLSQPIRRDGEILGVVCGKYTVAMFTKMLGTTQFKDYGATMIIQRNGQMISGGADMEQYPDFYAATEEWSFRGGQSQAHFRRAVEAGQPAFFTYLSQQGEERYLYMEPVGVSDWMMFSLVEAASIDGRLNALSMEAVALMTLNLVLYTVVVFCVWRFFCMNQQVLRDNQQDHLTGIYNRGTAFSIMSSFLRREGRRGMHACFFMDIDNFKGVNDTLGHGAGDDLLVDLSSLLRENFRESDVVSRYGGDEFLVWMKDISDKRSAERKAQELCRAAQQRENFPTISIGVSCYPQDGQDYQQLLEQADQAMYHAKAMGKNRYLFYSDIAWPGEGQ